MQRLAARFFLALFLGSSTLLAQPVFMRWDVMVGVGPQAVVAGDFNGDRRTDVAVVTGEGLFTIPNLVGKPMRPVTGGVSGSDLITGLYAPFVGVADLNGDGLDDLVSNGVLLLSNGDGTFRVARRDLAVVLGIGDFNGDGKVDLLQCDILPGNGLQSLRVLLGNGDGTFRPGATITTLPLGPVGQVVVADFSHDGRLDVAVLSGTLLVFLGQGYGAFGSAIQTQIPEVPMWMYLAADFNGDGIPDLTAPGGIALGNGDGTFPPPIPYPQGFPGIPIAAADFTGDGHVDLITSHLGNSILVFPGKGDGTLLPPTQQSVGLGLIPRAVVVAKSDYIDVPFRDFALVTANGSSNSVTLLDVVGYSTDPLFGLDRAVSAASGTALVAPGSLATLFGPTPVTGSFVASPPWPTRLGGISLLVDYGGSTRLSPLLYVSPTQIIFQVPPDLTTNEFSNLAFGILKIVDDRGVVDYVGQMEVDPVAPALFLVGPYIYVPAATAVRVEPDGTQVPIPVYTCDSSAADRHCDVSPIPLSTAGGRPIYLSFFGTGFHGATPENVTCEINGVRVPVVYAGPQGTPGVDQINVRLLPKVLDGFIGELMPVIIRIDGVPANSTGIAVR